jgi:hypothetical protein
MLLAYVSTYGAEGLGKDADKKQLRDNLQLFRQAHDADAV